MDDEELLKQFTDCVYFLASPLTCKKGIECEYRHSEIARLNPRDCWYWLGGSCFNPACAFRHPPLEGYKEALSESAIPQHGPPLPVNKANVTCYFYWNGFCNKGDKCSFLHGSVDDTQAWKSSVTATVSNAVPSEKKLSAGSNTGSTPIERYPDPSEAFHIEPANTQNKPKQDPQQLAPELAERSESPDTSATQCEETAVKSDSLLPAEGIVQSGSDMSTDQSSDEQVDGCVEREEWLESSPGFDVLVEGESENRGYEVDADYLHLHDEEDRELNVHYVEYDYEESDKYDPAYPKSGNLLEQEHYDAYDRLDDKKTCDYLSKITGQSRESIFCRLSSHKRNFLQVGPIFDGRRVQDLREHLKKRKVVDDHQGRFCRKHDSQHQVDHRVGPRRHGSHGEYGIGHRGRFSKAARLNRSRQQQFREKRPGKPCFLASEISSSRKPAKQQKRPSQEGSAIFSGPKTLHQIKEEKKKCQQNGDLPSILGSLSKTASNDFQGPKPLNEILKNKRRLGSVVDCYSNRD